MTNDLQQARIKAAARGIWKADNTTLGVNPPESMKAWTEETEGYVELARAALTAADAVVTEEQIAVTICAYLGHTGGIECEGDIDAARAILTLFHGGAK